MSQLDDFLARCAHVCAMTGMAQGTLSAKLLSGGKRLGDIGGGKDIGVRRLAKADAALRGIERQYGIGAGRLDFGKIPPLARWPMLPPLSTPVSFALTAYDINLRHAAARLESAPETPIVDAVIGTEEVYRPEADPVSSIGVPSSFMLKNLAGAS